MFAAYTWRMEEQPPKPRRFDSLEQEVFLSLWRTYDRLRELEERLFHDYDLTAQQYNALRLLRGAEPEGLRTLTLAARLISRAPDITRLLDKLEERGLVTRLRLPDNRRVVLARISVAGMELLRQLDQPLRECHKQQLGHLSADQLHALAHLLREARLPHEESRGDWI